MDRLYETAFSIGARYADVFGADLLRYLMGAGGAYLVINVLLARRLIARKIREGTVSGRQICVEVLASMRTVAIFAANGTVIAYGAQAGLMTIYGDIAAFGWVYFVASTLGLIVLHDAWFYWTHRLMHYPPIYRRFHRLHHKSHQPTPFTSYSFDVGEAMVNAVYLPLVLLFLPAHPIALFIFVSHMMLRNALAHCGYEIFPARADGRPLIGWMTTVTHHDMHHAFAGKNLGFYFTWWDRLMGTEHPDYLVAFQRVSRPVSRANLLIASLFAALLTGFGVAEARGADLTGGFALPGLGVIVEIHPCVTAPSTRCGTLRWVWDPSETPHATPGDMVMSGFRFDGKNWNGQLKSPQNGWTLKGTITRQNDETLLLRGCAGPIRARQIWRSTESLSRVFDHAN